MTLLVVLFICSLLVNCLLGWYVARLLKKYLPWSEDIDDLSYRLGEYHYHIKVVSEMESFYGDEILMNLLKHSREVHTEVQEFREAYSLIPIEDDDDEETLALEEGVLDGDNYSDEEEDDTSEEKAPFQRKAIFHQGP